MTAKKSYSVDEVKNGIRTYYRLSSFRKASLATLVPRSTIHGWVRQIGLRQQKSRKRWRRNRWSAFVDLVDDLSTAVRETPCTTAASIRKKLACDRRPSLSTIYRLLRRCGFTNKSIHWRRSSTAKDPLSKDSFIRSMRDVSCNDFVSLDEFSAISNDRPMKGWSQKGHKLYIKMKPAKRHKSSCIVAIGSDGVLACHVVKGAFNKVMFIEFMKEFIATGHLRGKTLLMDNLSFHKSIEIMQMCDSAGLRVQLTPPYSPECNPIENFFSVVKDELRGYLAEYGAPESYLDFEEVVHDCVHSAACRVRMPAFFEGFLDRAAMVL